MSVESSLYQQMKDDIRLHHLPSGVPLKQAELSQRYGVSRIPIRDVINLLKAEGWLTPHGKRGVMVPLLDWKEAEELYLMRAKLETLALERAFPSLTNSVLGAAQDILEQLDGDKLSMLERGDLNWQFHATLYRCGGEGTLFRTLVMLHQQVERYMGFQYVVMGYANKSQQEHYQMLDWLRQKELKTALNLLKSHIVVAGKAMVQHLKDHSGGHHAV